MTPLKTLKRVLCLTIGVMLTLPAAALAWGGGSVTDVSCPEIHAVLPVESGPWQVQVVEGAISSSSQLAGRTVLYSATGSGSSYPQVFGGFYTPTGAQYTVTAVAGNAANIADGFVYRTVTVSNCAAPSGTPGAPGAAGPQGPAGPQGAPGVPSKATPTRPKPKLKHPRKHHHRHHHRHHRTPKHHKTRLCRVGGSLILCGRVPPPPVGKG